MVRCWRNSCFARKTASKECITSNAYTCMELNAHAIVMLLDMCRESPEQFLVLCFSSQPAEELFRELRSMTTTLETAVEFSMREIGDRIRRAFMKVLVSYRQKDKYTFPNIIKKLEKYPAVQQIPSKEAIKNEIERARLAASCNLVELGLSIDEQSFNDSLNMRDTSEIEFVSIGTTIVSDEEDEDEEDPHEFEFISIPKKNDETASDSANEEENQIETDSDTKISGEDDEEEIIYNASELFPKFGGELRLKGSTSSKKHTFNIRDCRGKVHRIKKSKVLWMMTNGRSRQVNTRLARYKQKTQQNQTSTTS